MWNSVQRLPGRTQPETVCLLLIYITYACLWKNDSKRKRWNAQSPNKKVCVCMCVCVWEIEREREAGRGVFSSWRAFGIWMSAIKFCHTKPRKAATSHSLRYEPCLYLGRCCWLAPRIPSVGRPSPTQRSEQQVTAAATEECQHWHH
jgi:hypothetical protein